MDFKLNKMNQPGPLPWAEHGGRPGPRQTRFKEPGALHPEDFPGVPNGMTRDDCPRCGAAALHDMPEGLTRCCGHCGAHVHIWSFRLLPDMIHGCPRCGSANYAYDYCSKDRRPGATMEHGSGWCEDCGEYWYNERPVKL